MKLKKEYMYALFRTFSIPFNNVRSFMSNILYMQFPNCRALTIWRHCVLVLFFDVPSKLSYIRNRIVGRVFVFISELNR